MKQQESKDQAMQALIAKMRAGTKEMYEISIRELVIPVRILSIDEINQIRREAAQTVARTSGDDTDRNLHIQKTTLTLAASFGGISMLSDKFYAAAHISVDEINYLYNEYIRVLDSVNPSLEQISHEQFRAIVDGLKKNTVTSNDLSLQQLRAICSAYQELIQRQVTHSSQPDNSLGGQQ